MIIILSMYLVHHSWNINMLCSALKDDNIQEIQQGWRASVIAMHLVVARLRNFCPIAGLLELLCMQLWQTNFLVAVKVSDKLHTSAQLVWSNGIWALYWHCSVTSLCMAAPQSAYYRPRENPQVCSASPSVCDAYRRSARRTADHTLVVLFTTLKPYMYGCIPAMYGFFKPLVWGDPFRILWRTWYLQNLESWGYPSVKERRS